MDIFKENPQLLAPLIILQLILMVIALLDIRKRERVLGGNKLIWVFIIVIVNTIGPIVYLSIGRKD